MNKFFKVIVSVLMATLLLCLSVLPAFATVNGKEAPVGSTVEYTISISDCVQKITGIHLEIFFDQSTLKIKEVNTDNLAGSTTVNDNQNNDGTIRVVNGLINGASGLECKEKTDLVKVSFEVIAEGDTEIKYYIPYLYDYDMVNLYKYTLSQTISVDGEVVAENVPPVLAGDEDFAGVDTFDKGDFENSPQGTGSGIKVEPTKSPAQNTEAQTSDNGGEKDNTVTIALVCAGIIVVAIVVLVIAKSKVKGTDQE